MDSAKVDGQEACNIDYDSLLDSLTSEIYKSEIDFLGSEPMTIKTTNAQEIYNHYQMYPKILVFDLRDSSRYGECHLKCSVSMPINVYTSDHFINFKPKVIQDEFELKVDQEGFKHRKRSMCFIGKYNLNFWQIPIGPHSPKWIFI